MTGEQNNNREAKSRRLADVLQGEKVEETAQKSGSDVKGFKCVGEIPQEDTAQ